MLVDRACVEVEDLRDHADLAACARDRLAHVLRLDQGELLGVLLDEGREPAQQPRPVGRRHRRQPGSRARTGDGGVGLLHPGLIELGDRLLGGRVEHRKRHGADSNTIGRSVRDAVPPRPARDLTVSRSRASRCRRARQRVPQDPQTAPAYRVRDRHHGQHRFAPERFRLVERDLRVVDLDIERDVSRAVLARADPSRDAVAFLLDERIAQFGQTLCLPAEHLLVEAHERVAVLARDLEMDDRVSHVASSCWMACTTLRRAGHRGFDTTIGDRLGSGVLPRRARRTDACPHPIRDARARRERTAGTGLRELRGFRPRPTPSRQPLADPADALVVARLHRGRVLAEHLREARALLDLDRVLGEHARVSRCFSSPTVSGSAGRDRRLVRRS